MEQQLDAKLATENTHIDDSCSIRSKDDIIAYLTTLRENASPEMAVNQRSLQSQYHPSLFRYLLYLTQMTPSLFLRPSRVPLTHPRCGFGTSSGLV